MSKAKITQDDQQRFAALLGGDLANDPSHVKPIVTVKISGQTAGAITLGAKKYVGKRVQNEVAPTDPAWLESDLGDDDDLGFAAEDDCYVLDYAQAGRAADDIVNGNVIGYAPDGRYIVAVSGGGGAAAGHVVIKLTAGTANGIYDGYIMAPPASVSSNADYADIDNWTAAEATVPVLNWPERNIAINTLTLPHVCIAWLITEGMYQTETYTPHMEGVWIP
jgi:hypothetical protein